MHEGVRFPLLSPAERDFATGATHLLPSRVPLDRLEAVVKIRILNFVAALRRTIVGGHNVRTWPEYSYLREIDPQEATRLDEGIHTALSAIRTRTNRTTGKPKASRSGMRQYARGKRAADDSIVFFTQIPQLQKLQDLMLERLRLRVVD